jgi:hypothetical protein
MHLDHLPGDVHLTYCTNIHAGETWDEVRGSLEAHVPQIKAQVAPDKAFGIGLRLSAIAAEALSAPEVLGAFRAYLADHDCYVFTINAFPYGPFHGMVGSVSTVPGTFKTIAAARPDAPRAMADSMARHVVTLLALKARTGREIVLALEPEPCCFLETVEETLAFFRDHLHAAASADLVARQAGISLTEADDALHRHLGVCYDICHGAVEYEQPQQAFARFAAAGIRVAKLQLSSALRLPEVGVATERMLSAFDDGVYLHQVVQRRNGSLTRYVDLAPAFAALRDGTAGGEWRVHCHVPIFLETAGAFHSTQPTLKAALQVARSGFVAPHLEVETYTWDVLPADLRQSGRADAIAREMRWVIEELRG